MTSPEKLREIQETFRQRRLNEQSLLAKIQRYASKIGRPAVEQIYALYYLFRSPSTPARSKMMIVAGLLYFVSPIDSIPDLLGPLGFTDDITVIALICAQLKNLLTDDIRAQAAAAANRLFGSERRR